ncbi:hypothetical protein MKX01_040306 [Papaver californicum]|nr:hypothetical protein MKX01_040306 [Papaver californicum]
MESDGSNDLLVKIALDKMKEKGDDDVNSAPLEGVKTQVAILRNQDYHSSRDSGDYHSSSYSSRDKDRHRHHPYA